MKVVVTGNSPTDMQVTFSITNEEEKSAFHDRVAISLCDGPHDFIAHVYSPRDKASGPAEYDIPIKPCYSN
jgi:hypothetical protein